MYTDEIFNNPEIRRVMEKVQLVSDPKLDEDYSRSKSTMVSEVEIRTNNGKAYSKEIEYWRGCPENPLTKEELQDKFRR